jgi:hypothetical protein
LRLLAQSSLYIFGSLSMVEDAAYSKPPTENISDALGNGRMRPDPAYFAASDISPHGCGLDGSASGDDDFVLAEFAAGVSAGRRFADDLDACAQYDQPFANVVSKRYNEMANVAYPVFLQILAGREKAWAEVKEHRVFANGQRAPKRGTEAFSALAMVWKPTKEERSLCSSHATKLVFAAHKQISPEDFATEIAKTSLSECRAFAGKLRKRKDSAGHPVTDPIRRVTITWSENDKVCSCECDMPSKRLAAFVAHNAVCSHQQPPTISPNESNHASNGLREMAPNSAVST